MNKHYYKQSQCTSVSRQSTTSVKSYYNKPGPSLKGGVAHVLTSNNPRTQAVGVAIGAFAAIGAVASLAATALDIIGGNGRR